MSERRSCGDCAWWEITPNRGPLCWRPGDGPEPMPVHEGVCGYFVDRADCDIHGRALARAYHGEDMAP
jgi:hypothetical protein